MKLTRLLTLILPVVLASSGVQAQSKKYWNENTHLVPMRLPLPPAGFKPTLIDLNGDGKPDAIKSALADSTPILWLDDDGNMTWNDREGDMVNDCLLIDVNRDGVYGGYGDLIIDWVDEDGDGHPDMQIVINYPEKGEKEGAHYMIVRDLEKDDAFNYINWNRKRLECWDHAGLSDFYQDYHGQTMFMKMHASTFDYKDLRLNWENPFLFYDPDGDGLTEMTIRLCDNPQRLENYAKEGFTEPQFRGRCDWAAISVDIDNDNTTGNEFDLDFTLCFQGGGFDYTDQVHPVKNLRGLPEADKFFIDPRYRQLKELVYADHDAAPELIFKRGKWKQVMFTYDEDDDNGRWERVELYENRDPFKSGWKNGGVDNHKQSDAAGDRGEWDTDNSGGGKLYLSRFDGRMHLYGAERGVWRIDQNASYFEAWDRMWMGQERYPKSFATVVYTDTDNNGFFDHIEYDLDGDRKMETVIDFKELGIRDVCELIDVSEFKYQDYTKLGERMAEGIWKRAQEAVQVARQYGVNPGWYAKWMQARTTREKYNNGYWLTFYIYKDLEQWFMNQGDTQKLKDLQRAYYGGDWNIIAKKGQDGFYFISPEEIANIRKAAATPWGKKIIRDMETKVKERRTHDLTVPVEEGGHFHDYFCPVHNMELTFRWDKPKAHLCDACGKEYIGNNRFDRAWIYGVHFKNREYLYNCMYLYLATGQKKYANYIHAMLLDYASKYKGWMEHDSGRNQTYDHSGKAFAQSLDEASWGTRMALIYKTMKHIFTPAEQKKIEDGYLMPAARLLMARNGGGNWQMWHDSGLAAMGVALENDSIIDVALNRKGYGYHHMVRTMKNADGWINEGSPHYHYYPLEALIFTAQAVKCRGINLFDADLHDMFAEPVKGVYPDLSFAAHSDGWYGANLLSQTALYELASIHFPDALIRDVQAKAYAKKERLDPEALQTGRDIQPDATPLLLQSHSYNQSGFTVLRNGGKSLVFKFGGEGIGHGHPDKLSFTLHNGKKELISDFGTSGYGTPDYLGWYKTTLSHNTVTVDGKSQKKSKDRLLKYMPRKNGGYVEGETTTAYDGVTMRRAMDMDGNTISDRYTCTSKDEHVYEYVVIFNERPKLNLTGGRQVTLTESEPHKRLANAIAYGGERALTCRTADLDVDLSITDGTIESIVIAEAPGIPANPTVKDGPGAIKQAALKCYPLVLKIRGKNMGVEAKWDIK